MAGNKVVARYRDGRVIKGSTTDFIPTRDVFHVHPEGGGLGVPVRHTELKAIFFVRDYAGNPEHRVKNEYDTSTAQDRSAPGWMKLPPNSGAGMTSSR